MSEIPPIKLYVAGKFLERMGSNINSQFGEDGLIYTSLKQFGETNRWCFEVGAADGVFCSNTKALRDQGWDSVLIEADDVLFESLQKIADDHNRVLHKRIGEHDLDEILMCHEAPKDLDFGVIDIDGQDYYVWDGLQEHRPRLMLVEYAYWNDDQMPERGGFGQAGIKHILRLGETKGYIPLAATYCNVLFVREETNRLYGQ